MKWITSSGDFSNISFEVALTFDRIELIYGNASSFNFNLKLLSNKRQSQWANTSRNGVRLLHL